MKRKFLIVVITLLLVLIASIAAAKIYVVADEFANMVTIDNAQITKIQTGEGPFDNIEGIGNDISENDRIVRTFDTITYDVKFNIKAKENSNIYDFEDRKVEIIVSLSDEDAKYINFESGNHPNDKTTFIVDEDSKTARYIVEGVNTYGDFTDKVVLRVKNAPNGYEIKPTFKIKEQTDEDDAKEITLNRDIINYMPTIVSSKSNIDIFTVSSNESQIGNVDNEDGRFITFGIGIQLLGDNSSKGIKGLNIPNGDITFDIELTQSNNESLIIDEKYIRLYKNEKVNDIDPVKLDLPYNINDSKISITKKSDTVYTITIKDYNEIYNTISGTSNIIEDNRAVFVSIALTCFSKRKTEDGKNNIMVTLNVNKNNDSVSKTINGEQLKETTLSNNISTMINEYQEKNDYLLSGNFVDKNSYKNLSELGRNYGSVTRGDEISYKSSFNFKNSVLKTGISQIIKIDPSAYELIKLNSNEDYKINLNCNGKNCNIKPDDFIVKYVTGDFSSSNYEVINYSNDTIDSNLLSIDKQSIINQCKIVKDNYDNLTQDQIMNLYGGPCLKAKNGVEKEYTNIDKIGNEKITKIILETNDKKVLDNDITIDFIVGIKVKNVMDITQTYQGVTLVKSKGLDNIIYFDPSITNLDNSAANYNNYTKTVYKGTNAIVDDKTYGDSLKIVSYIIKNEINITNTKSDGTKKTSYNTIDNEILNYKIDINIKDNSISAGADDVWYIKSLKVTVNLPNSLVFKQNNNYLNPEIITNKDGTTTLVYNISYTKPNNMIDSIYFDAIFNSNISGANNEVVVTSTIDAINVNNEKDNSNIESKISKEIIYVSGFEGIVVTEDVLDTSKVIEKDKEFSYNISLYNSSNSRIENISLMNILPYNNDELGSKFSGTYNTKIVLPIGFNNVKAYCYTGDASKLRKEVDSTLNKWEECNIINDYVSASAFKLEGINIDSNVTSDIIKILIRPNGNDSGNIYSNMTYSKSEGLIQSSSQTASVRVVNRNISGIVFVDSNENGIKDDSIYLNNIDVSLCKLDSYNSCKNISNTKTDENGRYTFDKLDVGRYIVNFIYDADGYDVTHRYIIEDETRDSDAYKISDKIGNAQISGKSNGIRLTKDIEKQENLDIGLISRKGFEIDIKKGINNIELNNNGIISSYSYNFLKSVSLSVRKPSNLTAKVTYGFEVTNNRSQAGYIKLIEENIPDGMSFNPSYEENKNWFSVDGKVFYDSLKDTLIKPGETKTFEIVLDMNSRNEVGTFLNEVSILELESYEEKINNKNNNEYSENDFKVGSKLTYAGTEFYVIKDDGENVTLLASENVVKTKMGHTSNSENVYKWSTSLINKYINEDWLNETSIDTGILVSSEICDDSSSLEGVSYGGTLKEEGTCQSGIYNNYKVRLLTTKEFDDLLSTLDDVSFLIGTDNYWTMNSSYTSPVKDEFGVVINGKPNEAIYINKTTNPKSIKSTTKARIRPVITVPKSNILL